MQTAVETLQAAFPGRPLVLADADHMDLVALLATADIAGGQVYDAVIAMTARAAGATLLTLDRRAEPTYAAIGATIQRV